MRTYDSVICDVDGVLIDVSRSFTAAVVDAVEEASGSSRFTPAEVRILKESPGFNDDWHVAVAGGAWVRFFKTTPMEEFVAAIEAAGGGLAGLASLTDVPPATQFFGLMTRLAQEAYGGLDACESLYGFTPETIKQRGRMLAERPLPGAKNLRRHVQRLGIVSGRSSAEMVFAADMLGWSLSPDLVALSDDPALNKPNPEKLLAICALLGSERVVYAGDSLDDYELIRNAREPFPGQIDFAGIGPVRPAWNDAELQCTNIEELLTVIEGYDD